jgi:hypothetical protein
MQRSEQTLTDFFEAVAERCRERKIQHARCMQMSAHETLCSLLLAADIQPTLPLATIYRMSAKASNSENGIQLFRKQWEDYIRYIYAANVNEVQKQGAIDRNWFDKEMASVTFRTAFSSDLWLRTAQEEHRFDLFATGSILASKRPPEELLSSHEILDRDAPREARAVILSHLSNRMVRAQAKILNKALNKWLAKWKEHIQSLPPKLEMSSPSVFFEKLTAHDVLDDLVRKKQEKWAKLYEEEGGGVSAYADGWIKDADRLFEQKKAASDAAQPVLRQKMVEHIRLAAYRHWTTLTLDAVVACKRKLAQCREDDQVFQHIRRNWPSPFGDHCEAPGNKRRLIFKSRAAPGEIKADSSITEQVQTVLDSGFAAISTESDDELLAFAETLDRLETVLGEHAKQKESAEPLDERKLQFENAVFMDYAQFTKSIAERLSNQAQVLVQGGLQPEHKHIDELEKTEQELVKATLEAKEGLRKGYGAIYQQIHDCIATRVWARLKERVDRLAEFDELQRSTVAVYEPWLDRTALTSEQQSQLRELLPDLKEVPTTISAALIQSSAWFEQLYESECGV